MRNCTVLLLVVCLVVSSFSVLAVSSVSAQAGYKPSVPQISSVKIVDSSYDVPPSSTKTVDQYTGKETTNTKPGYHVNQKSIEITIKISPLHHTLVNRPIVVTMELKKRLIYTIQLRLRGILVSIGNNLVNLLLFSQILGILLCRVPLLVKVLVKLML